MGGLMVRAVLAACLAMGISRAAVAETYTDSAGFFCESPVGWTLISESHMAEVADALTPQIKDWVQRNKIDFKQVKVILLRNGDHEKFLENLNVVVEPSQITVSETSRRQLAELSTRRFAEAGLQQENYSSRIERIADREFIVSDYLLKFPDSMGVGSVRQRQYLIGGGGKTFTITCTALPETFETYEPVFSTVMASFKAPQSIATGFNWGAIASSGAIWGILGGLVGGLVGAAMKKKADAKKQRPSAPDRP